MLSLVDTVLSYLDAGEVRRGLACGFVETGAGIVEPDGGFAHGLKGTSAAPWRDLAGCATRSEGFVGSVHFGLGFAHGSEDRAGCAASFVERTAGGAKPPFGGLS